MANIVEGPLHRAFRHGILGVVDWREPVRGWQYGVSWEAVSLCNSYSIVLEPLDPCPDPASADDLNLDSSTAGYPYGEAKPHRAYVSDKCLNIEETNAKVVAALDAQIAAAMEGALAAEVLALATAEQVGPSPASPARAVYELEQWAAHRLGEEGVMHVDRGIVSSSAAGLFAEDSDGVLRTKTGMRVSAGAYGALGQTTSPIFVTSALFGFRDDVQLYSVQSFRTNDFHALASVDYLLGYDSCVAYTHVSLPA